MVTLSQTDFTTLSFTGPDGTVYSADPSSDWLRYTAFSATESAQAAAPGINANREKNYNTAIANYNASAGIGRTPNPATPPTKPTYLTVNDPTLNPSTNVWTAGVSTEGPWPHALTDPLAIQGAATTQTFFGGATASGAPFATQDLSVVISQNQQALTLLSKIAAKLGA